MCAVTHRAKPYQLALLINKSLDDVTIPILRYSFLQYIYALFAESSIDTSHLKKSLFYTIYELKLPLHVPFKEPISEHFPFHKN